MTYDVYTFEVGCPACGGRVEHVANGTPTNTRAAAVIHCHTCGIDGLVTVHVSMAYNRRDDIGVNARPTSDTRRAKDRERKRNQRTRQAATA